MSDELKNIIKIACIYLTTIIGAGFASGCEIIQFFSGYYTGGFYGIVLAGAIFSVLGFIVLNKVYNKKIKNFSEFLYPTLGYTAGFIVEIIATLFMLCQFVIMVAGSANILFDKLKIPEILAIIIMSLICMFFISRNIKGIVTLSYVVTPVLIVGMVLIGLYIIMFRDVSVFNPINYITKITNNWFFSSILYVSYNSLMSVMFLTSLLPYLKTRKTGRIGGILGGMMLCVVVLIMNTAMMLFYPDVTVNEIPMLAILKKYGSVISTVYAFILWLAILVHAVNSGFCFVDRVCSKIKISRQLTALALCIAAVPLATFGFSKLIATIYPVFGYIGLYMIFAILIKGWTR